MEYRRIVVVLVAAFFASSTTAETEVSAVPAEDAETELKLVHLVYRHGDRTLEGTYPNDPYQNDTFAPYGKGQLTIAGYNRGFNNGKFFRKRYDTFLGPLYNQNDIHLQSTGYPRTRMSLQLWCAGLFAPLNTNFEWRQNLNWQPIDFISVPTSEDTLLFPLGPHGDCLRQEWAKSFVPMLTKYKTVLDALSKVTGVVFERPFDVITLYYALQTEVEYGLPLPEWAKDYYPDKLHALSNEAWGYIVYNDVSKRILAGELLQSMISDWEAKIAGTMSKKFVMYSGHDLTVVSILGACNLWNPLYSPDYGITAIFELRQNRKTGEYGVQVFMRNQPKNEPTLLTIPGCKSFCPLSQLKTILSRNLPTPTDCNAV